MQLKEEEEEVEKRIEKFFTNSELIRAIIHGLSLVILCNA